MLQFQFLAVGILISLFSLSQSLPTTTLAPLPTLVNESSGLALIDGRLITHNDSDNEPVLYELDTTNGTILRTVWINAPNIDWEDLTADNDYLYIGDFGNNLGNRTNLKILKVHGSDFSLLDSLQPQIIEFAYGEQTNFNPGNFNTDYDAEALISEGNHLYIFTKQWSTAGTRVYQLPKNAGSYTIFAADTIPVNGLITSADYWAAANRLVLTGYTLQGAFAMVITNFSWPNVSDGDISIYNLPLQGSYQVEALVHRSAQKAFFTSEQSFTGAAYLHSLDFSTLDIKDESFNSNFIIYPNPAAEVLHIKPLPFGYQIFVYDSSGNVIKRINRPCEDCPITHNLSGGVYFIALKKGNQRLMKKFVVSF